MSTTVDFAEVKDKLLTLDQVRERLETTEPFSSANLSKSDNIAFRLDADWTDTLDTLHGDDVAGAYVTINGKEHQLTKDAALEAGAKFGIPGALAKKARPVDIERMLNFFYNDGIGEKEFKLLFTGTDQKVSAFVKPNLVSFSNRQLLNHALYGIEKHFGEGEVFADYKFSHSVHATDIRLILPEYTRIVSDTEIDDDAWSAGIHISNSLTGARQTGVEAYLFRWWCTNGATTEMSAVGNWSRRSGGQDEVDVYEWARASVDEILGGMEHKFEQVQALTSMELGVGVTQDVLREIFTQFKIPVSQREDIMNELTAAPKLTMYALMQAITRTANDPTLRPERADALMRIGGNIPTSQFDTSKAQIFRQGQQAGPQARNPYAVHMAEAN